MLAAQNFLSPQKYQYISGNSQQKMYITWMYARDFGVESRWNMNAHVFDARDDRLQSVYYIML